MEMLSLPILRKRGWRYFAFLASLGFYSSKVVAAPSEEPPALSREEVIAWLTKKIEQNGREQVHMANKIRRLEAQRARQDQMLEVLAAASTTVQGDQVEALKQQSVAIESQIETLQQRVAGRQERTTQLEEALRVGRVLNVRLAEELRASVQEARRAQERRERAREEFFAACVMLGAYVVGLIGAYATRGNENFRITPAPGGFQLSYRDPCWQGGRKADHLFYSSAE